MIPPEIKRTIDELMQNANDRVRTKVSSVLALYSDIKWKRVKFIIPTPPIPSHRPRLCGYRVYVPGAAKNQAFFNKHVLPKLKGLFISTPCKIKVDIYCQTPKSFSKAQTILAEMGIIRPWVNTGDVDNYDKAVFDMMQPNDKRGHVGIMSNDCLILDNYSKKWYSINPRYEVEIEYMGKIPEQIKNIMRMR